MPSARPGLRRRFTNRIEVAAHHCRCADSGWGIGLCESRDFPGRYPRLQILNFAELLAGKKLECPADRIETFTKLERKTKHAQEDMF